ncbi:MAG: hypothetical protein LH606_19890 [Cytophagaceae bacterium]|nr:hypothetical protein [Cytophagaceae bacterium]
MKRLIEEAFPVAFPCLETHNDTCFGVIDPLGNKKCFVSTSPDETAHFKVLNPSAKQIHFLAIDHCLASSSDPQRCDFALFDEVTFCFVEIKETNRPQQRAKHRQRAKEQLLETIQWFQTKIDFSEKSVEAHLCVGRLSPRPKLASQDAAAVLRFAILGVILYDDNEQTFE